MLDQIGVGCELPKPKRQQSSTNDVSEESKNGGKAGNANNDTNDALASILKHTPLYENDEVANENCHPVVEVKMDDISFELEQLMDDIEFETSEQYLLDEIEEFC